MMPLHYMRCWLFIIHRASIPQRHSSTADATSFWSAAAAANLVRAGSAGCVLLSAIWHRAMSMSACCGQVFVAAQSE